MHKKPKGMSMLGFFSSISLIQKRILLKQATERKFALPKDTVNLGPTLICSARLHAMPVFPFKLCFFPFLLTLHVHLGF